MRSLNDPNAPRILMRTALFVACGFLTSSSHTATLTVSSTAETSEAVPGNGAWPDSAPEFSGNVAVISAQTLQSQEVVGFPGACCGSTSSPLTRYLAACCEEVHSVSLTADKSAKNKLAPIPRRARA